MLPLSYTHRQSYVDFMILTFDLKVVSVRNIGAQIASTLHILWIVSFACYDRKDRNTDGLKSATGAAGAVTR